MKDGDPFDTERRDKLRRTQRRRLRLIDDWFVQAVAKGVSPPEVSKIADRDLSEEILRVEAGERLEVLGDTLEAIANNVRTEARWRLFENVRAQVSSPRLKVYNLPALKDLGSQALADNDASGPTKIPTYDEDETTLRKLVTLVALLIVAEDLAQDSYTDDRIQRGRKNPVQE